MGDRSLDEFVDAGRDGPSEAEASDGSDTAAAEQRPVQEAAGGDAGNGDGTAAATEPSADSAGADGGETADASGAGSAADATAAASAAREATEADDQAAVTAAWDPCGGVCAACGAVVERRWRGAAGLVCPDCKEW
jgi:hypothetical protein